LWLSRKSTQAVRKTYPLKVTLLTEQPYGIPTAPSTSTSKALPGRKGIRFLDFIPRNLELVADEVPILRAAEAAEIIESNDFLDPMDVCESDCARLFAADA
jgi:hypothetical protein